MTREKNNFPALDNCKTTIDRYKMSNFEMNNNSDSYENIFAEWEIKPLNEEVDEDSNNYFRDDVDNGEEEVFPTSSTGSVGPKVEDVKVEPVKIGNPVKTKKELPPLPPGIENMMGSLLKMFGGDIGINNNDKQETINEEEDDSISKIELKALGCLLKMFALTILGLLGWLMDQLRDRVPLSHAFDSIQKVIADDINRGMWNDMFNTPDEFLEYQFPSVVYNFIDQAFGFLYFIVENNRIFIPVVAFLVGYWMA